MTISLISNHSPVTPANSATSDAQVGQQAEFMSVLLAQMKNQDPTNPMSNSDMSTQMSQLNVVKGITQLNATMLNVANSLQSGQTTQSAGLLGKTVLVPGSELHLSNGIAPMGAELAQSADSVTVTILDSSGNVVQTIDLGAQEPGTMNLSWDGISSDGTKSSDGDYTFNVSASKDSQTVTSTSLSAGLVGDVTISSSGGVSLSVPPIGDFSLASVRQIRAT